MDTERKLLNVHTEAVAWGCSVKMMFLKFHKIHRKTPVLESLFDKVEGLKPAFKKCFQSFDILDESKILHILQG